MFVQAQITLYPLRQARLSPVIDDALNTFRQRGLEVSPGVMSSLVSRDDEALFAAVKDVFRKSS
jgi:uncharacterized protein YqgV (UPF0045/DUF77 family)